MLAAMLLIVASGYAVVRSNTLDKQLAAQKQQLAEFTKENLDRSRRALRRPESSQEGPKYRVSSGTLSTDDRNCCAR